MQPERAPIGESAVPEHQPGPRDDQQKQQEHQQQPAGQRIVAKKTAAAPFEHPSDMLKDGARPADKTREPGIV